MKTPTTWAEALASVMRLRATLEEVSKQLLKDKNPLADIFAGFDKKPPRP